MSPEEELEEELFWRGLDGDAEAFRLSRKLWDAIFNKQNTDEIVREGQEAAREGVDCRLVT